MTPFFDDEIKPDISYQSEDLVRSGRKAWKVVEKARGKGSMKEKVLELQREQEESKIVEEKEKVLTTAVLEEGRKELDQ